MFNSNAKVRERHFAAYPSNPTSSAASTSQSAARDSDGRSFKEIKSALRRGSQFSDKRTYGHCSGSVNTTALGRIYRPDTRDSFYAGVANLSNRRALGSIAPGSRRRAGAGVDDKAYHLSNRTSCHKSGTGIDDASPIWPCRNRNGQCFPQRMFSTASIAGLDS